MTESPREPEQDEPQEQDEPRARVGELGPEPVSVPPNMRTVINLRQQERRIE